MVKIDNLKKSIESEDEGGDLQMVVENRSLERVGGSRQSRLPHSQHNSQNVSSTSNSRVRESSEHGIKLMKVNVELNNEQQSQINRLPTNSQFEDDTAVVKSFKEKSMGSATTAELNKVKEENMEVKLKLAKQQ